MGRGKSFRRRHFRKEEIFHLREEAKNVNRFVIKHFFRQKICLILGLLLYAVGWGFLLFLAGKGFSGFMLLHTLARGCFYICFGWVCLTFYFISSPNRSDIKEASDSICGTSVYEKNLYFLSAVWFCSGMRGCV